MMAITLSLPPSKQFPEQNCRSRETVRRDRRRGIQLPSQMHATSTNAEIDLWFYQGKCRNDSQKVKEFWNAFITF